MCSTQNSNVKRGSMEHNATVTPRKLSSIRALTFSHKFGFETYSFIVVILSCFELHFHKELARVVAASALSQKHIIVVNAFTIATLSVVVISLHPEIRFSTILPQAVKSPLPVDSIRYLSSANNGAEFRGRTHFSPSQIQDGSFPAK